MDKNNTNTKVLETKKTIKNKKVIAIAGKFFNEILKSAVFKIISGNKPKISAQNRRTFKTIIEYESKSSFDFISTDPADSENKSLFIWNIL